MYLVAYISCKHSRSATHSVNSGLVCSPAGRRISFLQSNSTVHARELLGDTLPPATVADAAETVDRVLTSHGESYDDSVPDSYTKNAQTGDNPSESAASAGSVTNRQPQGSSPGGTPDSKRVPRPSPPPDAPDSFAAAGMGAARSNRPARGPKALDLGFITGFEAFFGAPADPPSGTAAPSQPVNSKSPTALPTSPTRNGNGKAEFMTGFQEWSGPLNALSPPLPTSPDATADSPPPRPSSPKPPGNLLHRCPRTLSVHQMHA